MPLLSAGLFHERSDDRAVGKTPFDLAYLAQVVLQRAVSDELDVVHPDHALAIPIQSGKARGDVNDWIAQRLPHGTTPAGFEGPHDLVAAIGRRCGRQPKWVGTADSGKRYTEISHDVAPMLHARFLLRVSLAQPPPPPWPRGCPWQKCNRPPRKSLAGWLPVCHRPARHHL